MSRGRPIAEHGRLRSVLRYVARFDGAMVRRCGFLGPVFVGETNKSRPRRKTWLEFLISTRSAPVVTRRRAAALAVVVLVGTAAATAQAAPPTTDGSTPAASAPEDTMAQAAVTETVPPEGSAPTAAGITSEPFGEVDGEAVELYTLTNANGMEVKIMTYGGIIQSVRVPDRDGNLANVTLNKATLDDYVAGHPYFGSDHRPLRQPHRPRHVHPRRGDVPLALNNGENTLHGGEVGFDKVVWAASEASSDDGVGLMLSRTSPDGEEGYPGDAGRRGHLHADRRRRDPHRLPRHDRRADRGQPDQPLLLEPRRRGLRHDVRPRAADQRSQLHPGRRAR